MDRARGIREYLLLLLLAASGAACSGPALIVGPDAAVEIEPDSGDLSGGMALQFRTNPVRDVELDVDGTTFKLDEVRINLSNLRLIGDAATGDDRTRIDLAKLRWDESSGPTSIAAYPEAPPGLYSLVRGAVTSFKVEVEAEREDGQDIDIEIEFDDSPLAIDFALDTTLEVGVPLELEVVVNLAAMLAAIDIDELEIDDDKAEIEGEELEQLAEILSTSFAIQTVR